jgi:CO dehydrogenase maturation factor
MKIMISGKGGSGKSTLAVLLAKALVKNDCEVLLVDADESNMGVSRLLGAADSDNLMESMGGRQSVKTKLWSETASQTENELFKAGMKITDLPDRCVTQADGVKLLVMGKIQNFGDGCACLIGTLSKTVLAKLDEGDNAMVIIDAEAGVEHFGRKVDSVCDLIIGVVDPTYESFMLSGKMQEMAATAGIEIVFVLNKTDETVTEVMVEHLDSDKVIAQIPYSKEIFTHSLHGKALSADLPEIEKLGRFLKRYKKPVRLNVA